MSDPGKVMSWLHDRKDNSVSFVLERLLRREFERFGRIIGFQIDSRRKAAQLDLLLNGESEPIALGIELYEVVENEAGTFLTIQRASVSREWMNLLLAELVLGRRFQIPDKHARLAKMLL
jgi:hypothetical protein